MPSKLVMPSNHLIICHPLLLPSIFPSVTVFWNESAVRIRWPKYWSFSFSISPSNEYSGLISFRMDWLDPFAVQGTLKSLLQHHSSRASILQCSAFFIVQLSHPYMTTGKITTWQVNSKNGNWWTKGFKKYFTPFCYGMLEVYTKVNISVDPSASHQLQQWLISWNHCVP